MGAFSTATVQHMARTTGPGEASVQADYLVVVTTIVFTYSTDSRDSQRSDT